ncbi:MAG: AsnC family transcriptional regulator [Rhodobacterales bacterium]|nr:MAG: AsnC family transcriptional regulator [Rhodobacterales bacterium]
MTYQPDAVDRRILKALVEDGRLSNKDLAKKVGLSPSPCWQRQRRLEKEGIINGYSASINHDALGVAEIVLIEVSLEQHDARTVDAFSDAMANIPEVLEVYLMAGDCDYLIKVATNGTKGMEAFLRQHIFKIKGIRHLRSRFALRCIKKSAGFVPQ